MTIIYADSTNTAAASVAATQAFNLLRGDAVFNFFDGTSAHGLQALGSNVITIAGTVHSKSASGIDGLSGGHRITVATTGVVVGGPAGISLAAGGNAIANQGTISGGNLVGLSIGGTGSNTIVNSGNIFGFTAVAVAGGGNTLSNSGFIHGVFQGLLFTGDITNTGSIINDGYVAIDLSRQVEGPVTTINNLGGTIQSGIGNALGPAIIATTGKDVIRNTGTIDGDGFAINFLQGDDLYDGRGGKAVGIVHGDDGNDTLIGGTLSDTLWGDAKNDTLNGGGGADSLDGGDGDDKYVLGADTTDTITDSSGYDTVFSTITRNLATSWGGVIDNLALQGAAAVNGTGNANNNVMTGNSANNILVGGGATDTINGGGGSDSIFGQAGADLLRGDAGNDYFVLQSVNDSLPASRDIILDFDKAGMGDDFINLTQIPNLVPGSFINGASFTGLNQVRIQQFGANVVVQINTTGDNMPDAEIVIANTTIGNGVAQVNAGDFLL